MTPPRTLAAAIESNDNSFNLVRLVAALLVVLYHAGVHNTVAPGPDPLSALLAPIADIGALAVDVFFVLSGIFITQSWMRDPDLLRFVARRVARLVPGLFVCLTATIVVGLAGFSPDGLAGLAHPAPWRYIVNGSMLHWLVFNIPPEELALPRILGGAPLNGSLWTVYWEGRMYVAVALIGVSAILPTRSWMMAMSLLLWLSAFVFPAVLGGYIWEARLWTLFLSGMLLQTLSAQVRFGPRPFLVACVLLVLNWKRWMTTDGHGLTFVGVILVCVTLALWVGTLRMPRLRHLQRHDYSYGIYIYHWPVMIMLKTALPPVGIWTLLAATLAIVLPLAFFSWHWIEAPALASVRALLARRRARAAVPASAAT